MAPTQTKDVKKDGKWTVEGRPRESIKLLTKQTPSNLPGKTIVALLLTLPPGAATPSHTHSGASVLGLMLQGKSLNQMNDDPAKSYKEGEIWFEAPGCHHVRSENDCDKDDQDAVFYAVIIVDNDVLEKCGFEGLFVLDSDKEEKK